MKEEYLKKEWWDRFPGATHFSPGDEDHYPAFWKVNENGKPTDDWLIFEDNSVEHITGGILLGTSDNISEFIKRPESFPKDVVENDSKIYIPKVGEVCLARCWNEAGETGFRRAKFIGEDSAEVIFRWVHSGSVVCHSKQLCNFKPLPKEPTMEEKLLDKWKRQSLDYCYDTEDSQYSLKSVFQFLNKFYELQEK